MSFPNNGQQGSANTANPAFNPALLNANAALANFNLSPAASSNPALNPNLPPAVQQQISNFNPAQLARLTEFHRQIPQQQQQHQQPANAPAAPVRPSRPPISVPQHVRDILSSTNMSPEQKNDFLQRWLKTDEGRQASLNHRQANAAAQAAFAAANTGVRPTEVINASPSARPGQFVSPQMLSGNLPAASSASINGSGTVSYSGQPFNTNVRPPSNGSFQLGTTGDSATGAVRPQNLQQNRPQPSGLYAVHPSVPAGWDAPARRPTSPDHVTTVSFPTSASAPASAPAPALAPASTTVSAPRAPPAPRRREEGMRGTMRSESKTPTIIVARADYSLSC